MKILKKYYRKLKKALKRANLRKIEILVLAVVILEFVFPQVALANNLDEGYGEIEAAQQIMISPNIIVVEEEPVEAVLDFSNSLPLAENKPKRVIWVTVTAYSSTVDQCDANPCRTANGFDLCVHNQEDVVAANFLPFGTAVKMPDYFGDQVFTVEDRMNGRYYYRIDVWMKTREAAKQFGIRKLKVEIY